MRKIQFADLLPHSVAIAVFLVVTISFFSPIFFENKSLDQHDIQQHIGSSKALRDFRDATGEEGLWAGAMFSGMPAYLVNLQWSDGVAVTMKKVMSLLLPHPVSNIFLGFLCYYIMLLTFRIRPYLAIPAAIAFGLSSYLIVGLGAGHNARIGAIAFMPLVMAGVHLAFSGKKMLGFGVTAAGLALHLRENHLQITYYLLIIVAGYGLVQLVMAVRKKQLAEFFTTLGLLVPAALVAAGTFFGQFWAITEYSHYSIRGPSELTRPDKNTDALGLSKKYAFEYSNGILEPMTLIIPNFYGGSTSNYFVQNEKSESYKALVNSGDNQLANRLAQYTRAYWGPQQNTAPYYAGAITVLLFVIGILFADKKYVAWLVPLSLLSIVLSWGDSFSTFNYFLFDYFPGYNKFRSVTFALIIILFSMPLLGMLGLQNLLKEGWSKSSQKKLWWALALVPGVCLVVAIMGGVGSVLKPEEVSLPAWFRSALQKDRVDLVRSDAWRSFWFAIIFSGLLFAGLRKWVKEYVVILSLALLMLADLPLVDKRYLTKDSYQRKRDTKFIATEVTSQINADKTYFRVYNLDAAMGDAATSYFHNSIGGYHGAKLRRYQELYDSCIQPQTAQLLREANVQTAGDLSRLNFSKAGVINMLNARYLTYNNEGGLIVNHAANGPAWFVKNVELVGSPTEELKRVGEVDTRETAVVDKSKFDIPALNFSDSLATIVLSEQKPYAMKYESQSSADGIALFSEIYYPKGWHAWIDGKEATILRADYVLRALEVPAGKHVIEFKFEPKPYLVGNKITQASGWVLLLLVLGSLWMSMRKSSDPSAEHS
jgi:hypothetical protein